MSQQVVYGFPCVMDPHNFHPDAECSSPEEREAHRIACANYGKPTFLANKGCTTERDENGVFVKHTLRTSWGIGINILRSCDVCKEPEGATDGAFLVCHDCGMDFCATCWPAHEKGDEP
jgi:hypothetical protein